MIKYKSFISVQSVVAPFLETQKKLERRTRKAQRFLDGMSLSNPKNYNKGRAICILNPEGIPSHSPGLRLQPRVVRKKPFNPNGVAAIVSSKMPQPIQG
jgi:hypothetical protein